ncbi:MAG: hypothetical protein LKE33_07275 [Acidaminococcus sp.]|jgi:hypothetical protein|nr:hypothetical protein [Acidaminococcus sp.]MCI2099813.1 hypothetical protein [Acidaminococcus sp.]MCI2114041.1 hypothetical protein [Acidaminococcus sp.]MCI2115911.1 hypothetical protein [Acidaminococcus sp.]
MKKRLLLSLVVGSMIAFPAPFTGEAAETPSWRTHTTRYHQEQAQKELERQEALKAAEEARKKAEAEAAAQPMWRRYITKNRKAQQDTETQEKVDSTTSAAPEAETKPAVKEELVKETQAAEETKAEPSALEKFRARANARTAEETQTEPQEETDIIPPPIRKDHIPPETVTAPAAQEIAAPVETEEPKQSSALEKFRARARQRAAEEAQTETDVTPAPAEKVETPTETTEEPKQSSALEKFRARANAKGTEAEPTAKKVDTSLQNESLPTVPTDAEATWELAASNSRYEVSFDSRSLEYDQKTGIITVWNKWHRRGGNDIYLYSRYDVRLKTFADLYRAEYGGKGHTLLSEHSVTDIAWTPLSPHTLGMELCYALNTYLLNK